MKSCCNKMQSAENNYLLYGGEVGDNLAERYKSLGEFYTEILRDAANKTEIIDAKSGQKLSRENMRAGAEHLAEFLRQSGAQTGDVVTIISENRLEYPIVCISAFLCGVTINTLSPYYTENEILHAFRIVRPKFIFLTPSVLNKIRNAMKEVSLKSILIQFEGGNPREQQVLNFDDILKNEKFSPKIGFKPAKVDSARDIAVILMSSGTTGLPKCVQISHKNILTGFSGTMDIFTELRKQNTVVLLITPWAHNFGFMVLLRLVVFGSKMISIQRFEENFYLQTIQDYRVSICFVAPPLMVFFSKSAILNNYNLSSLRILYSGGAPLSKEIIDGISTRLPRVELIYNGYGLTETTMGVLHANSQVNRLTSIGLLYKGLWGKVVDLQTGKSLPPHHPGEMCFKGDQIMIGYRDNEEATKSTIDADGWLHSGDIGYYNENKEFFIIGRSKEIIKYKGFQVPPVELEALLLGHPKVQDAAVIGVPDDIAGELPMALVVKKPNVQVIDKELVDFVNNQISNPKRLRGGLKFVSEIPKNVNGKIMRQVLKSQYGSGFVAKL